MIQVVWLIGQTTYTSNKTSDGWSKYKIKTMSSNFILYINLYINLENFIINK